MKILESIRIAVAALKANKARSLLTMLGIIIGVSAVITMMAVGSGATGEVEEQISSIGSNIILVLPGSLTSGGVRLGAGSALSLTDDDAEAMARDCVAVAATSAVVRGAAQVTRGSNNWSTVIMGVSPSYLEIRDYSLESGRSFTGGEVSGAAKVALIGRTVAQNLFGASDPVGKLIRIRDVPFTVIGLLAPKGQSPSGQDQDDVIITPITTARLRVLGASHAGARAVGVILAQAAGPKLVDEAVKQVSGLLRERHHLQPNEPDDFTVRNLADVFAAQEATARTMSLLLGAIASISLLVGGIGIMNIMLASVLERTREIGTRIAVGARRRDILVQFVVEALTLSLAGGLIGIVMGVGAAFAIARLAHWSTLLSWGSALVAFGFAGLVGVFFGYYPARKAALLDPIEALRYE